MRGLALTSLAILAVTCVGTAVDVLTDVPSIIEVTSHIALADLLLRAALLGLLLALIASLWGCIRAVKRHQWGWLVVLVDGFLAPLPVGLALSLPLAINAAGLNDLQWLVPICVGLLLTPVAALVYSSQRAGHAATSDARTTY
jgi:hypothetical protein